VIDAPTAAMYIAAGADFVVGPTLSPPVARLCNRHKVAYIPGCGSATEITRAEALGAEIVKLFPAQGVGGPGFIRATLAPSPWSRLMPAGGVDATKESLRAWFEAGAACVAMGSKLIPREAVAARDWEAITRTVSQVLAWIEEVRAER